MGKIIYINGTAVVETPYFKSPLCAACTPEAPEGAEILSPNEDGLFVISDEKPQSIFNKYYAKGDFTTYQLGAVLLHKDYSEALEDYKQIIGTLSKLIETEITRLSENYINIIYGQTIVSIIAAVETFICDTILIRITENENEFRNFHKFLFNPYKREAENLLKQGKIGEYEQKIIEGTIELAYSKIERIEKIYNEIFNINITDTDNKMYNHIQNRHKFAHKNGRGKDGSYVEVSKEEINELISDANHFVEQIVEEIRQQSPH